MTSYPLILSILRDAHADLLSTIQLIEGDGDLYSDDELLEFWRRLDALKTVVEGGMRAMDRVRKLNWITRGSI